MWIESHQSLRNHRKTGRLARKLGVSKVTAIGHLHCLWWWCMDNAPDGNLAGIEVEDIADGAEWEGDPSDFCAALCYAGFVDEEDEDDPARLHGWHDYAGKLIEKREKDAARKRESRRRDDDQEPSPVRSGTVQRTSDGHPRDGAGTVPNLTVPYQEDTHPQPPQPIRPAVAPPLGGVSARRVPKPTTLTEDQRERFERWYSTYPNKQHRPDAEKAFAKLNPDDSLTEQLIADIRERRTGRKWSEGFVEYPATYLNQRIWEDDIERTTPLRRLSQSDINSGKHGKFVP